MQITERARRAAIYCGYTEMPDGSLVKNVDGIKTIISSNASALPSDVIERCNIKYSSFYQFHSIFENYGDYDVNSSIHANNISIYEFVVTNLKSLEMISELYANRLFIYRSESIEFIVRNMLKFIELDKNNRSIEFKGGHAPFYIVMSECGRTNANTLYNVFDDNLNKTAMSIMDADNFNNFSFKIKTMVSNSHMRNIARIHQ